MSMQWADLYKLAAVAVILVPHLFKSANHGSSSQSSSSHIQWYGLRSSLMLIKMFRLGRLVRLIRLVRHKIFHELKASRQ